MPQKKIGKIFRARVLTSSFMSTLPRRDDRPASERQAVIVTVR